MDMQQLQDRIIVALADGPLRASELLQAVGDTGEGLFHLPALTLLRQGRITRRDILVDDLICVDTEYELAKRKQRTYLSGDPPVVI